MFALGLGPVGAPGIPDAAAGIWFGIGGGRSGGVNPSTDIADGSVGSMGGLLDFCPNLPISPPFGFSVATCLFIRMLRLVADFLRACIPTYSLYSRLARI